MKVDDLIKQARERLTAITAERSALDAEERKIRRMLEAADGAPPTPDPQPTIPWPSPILPAPAPHPFTPWQPPVEPLWAGHGGNCACSRCVPRIICTIEVAAQPPSLDVLFVGEVHPDWDLPLRGNGVRLDPRVHVGGAYVLPLNHDQRYAVS